LVIVAGPDGFAKGQYRKFNIRTEITPGDDYAMMREVLERRFRRLAENEAEAPLSPAEAELSQIAGEESDGPDGEDVLELSSDEANGDEGPIGDGVPDRPDLVLVDGGAGQLAVAAEVMAELRLKGIHLAGVAKGPDRDAGREHFHLPGRAPFMLEPRDPVLYFVQRLRDEAHRFAIGTHRAKRAKSLGVNPLDDIAGIGPTRKRALLKHFGSAKAVSRAGVDDLAAVDGISGEMARKIYDFFHEKRT
ncbi:helix-hairpin-helix domain-containing protein, partial [uncultured Hyphomicrobium sp.]|uniref:helix-hairpin-helix domain-containing protein n=1 Tax=uncultured Hyphomicrobium sp. TaxID=194373 RepID=UPI0025FF6E11